MNVQQQHTIAAEGYQASPVRTGYEQIIADRVDDLFAYTAKQNGVVQTVSDKHITVLYEDGTKYTVELGRRFGISAGSMVPHTLKTGLRLGDRFKAGDLVAYNTGFFQTDGLNPKQAVWKAGVLVKTALMESPDTLEDSSAISERLAGRLASQTTYVRNIVLGFDQHVRNMVKVGSDVGIESILCMIEDAVTADNTLFDEQSIDTLRYLSAQTPLAKYKGRIEKIDVFYHGDKDDMNETLRSLADESDRNMRRLAKLTGNENSFTGSVDSSMRVDNNPLELDHLVIRVYITKNVTAGVGDKGVFANQLKTVVGRVMYGTNRTESGEDIDAIFGYQSISDRIVLSPEIMGTTNTLLKVLGKKFAEIYRKG